MTAKSEHAEHMPVIVPASQKCTGTTSIAPVTQASLRLDPEFDALRSDPMFQKLLELPKASDPAP